MKVGNRKSFQLYIRICFNKILFGICATAEKCTMMIMIISNKPCEQSLLNSTSFVLLINFDKFMLCRDENLDILRTALWKKIEDQRLKRLTTTKLFNLFFFKNKFYISRTSQQCFGIISK